MRYYKIINNNNIIGAISSDNFIRYQALNDYFLRCDENSGEYISYKGKLYRSLWMQPIKIQQEYTLVTTIEISEEEYNILEQAIDNNKEIPVEEEEEEIPEEPEEPSNEFLFVLNSKINEMSRACRQAIESGFDLELRGETKHFSLTTQDQLNLMSLSVMAQTQSLIPYHADGEETDFYTSEEIKQIVEAANALKIQHTAYYNALKTYINALETIEDISAITYGVQIPDEYKSDVLKVLEQ